MRPLHAGGRGLGQPSFLTPPRRPSSASDTRDHPPPRTSFPWRAAERSRSSVDDGDRKRDGAFGFRPRASFSLMSSPDENISSIARWWHKRVMSWSVRQLLGAKTSGVVGRGSRERPARTLRQGDDVLHRATRTLGLRARISSS